MDNKFSIEAIDCRVHVAEVPIKDPLKLLHLFRGALGRVLAESASTSALEGNPCTFSPPCGYDVMHNVQGYLHGRPLPKPFVLRIDRAPNARVITMRLFGRAGCWKHVMSHAMIAAARRGIDLGKGSSPKRNDLERAPLTVLDADIVDVTPSAVGRLTFGHLNFETPMVLRADVLENTPEGRPVDPLSVIKPIFDGLELRIAGLAKWHDQSWEMQDTDLSGLITGGALRRTTIKRGPRKIRRGVVGTLDFEGLPPRLRHTLALAEIAHCGADTVIGAGRISLRA